MNDSEDRNRSEQQPHDPKENGLCDFDTQPTELPSVGMDIFSQRSTNGSSPAPQWYGVSYGGHTQADIRDAKEKKKRTALLITLSAVLLVLSLLMGYVGAMLYNNYPGELPGSNAPAVNGGSPTGSDTGLGLGEEIFGAEGNIGFDYGSVVLHKNDGSALTASTNGSAGEAAMSKIDVVARVKASVVEITTTATSNYGSVAAGAGSGVIIHESGVIVTNHHVIEGASGVYVRLTNGNTYQATVRGTDEDGDIAVIKIDPKETLTVARLGCSTALVEGEEVLAIGNPLGELGGTVTDGIVSQVEREINVGGVTMTLLQTNAAINSGNSGGGLFNMAGELIGVVNAKYSASGVEGLGFAIPVDTAMISINHLLKLGYIPNVPAIGVTLAEGTVRQGFYYRQVVYVYEAGDHADLKYQDILISVDGTAISTLSELKQVVRAHNVGDTVTVVVSRDGSELSLSVTLVEYVPTTTS